MSDRRGRPSPPSACDADPLTGGGLAELLKMRAAAQSAGFPDLEKQIRDKIRQALPIRKLPRDEPPTEHDSGSPLATLPPPATAQPPEPPVMRTAQLATLPSIEGRRTERRVVNLAADLREPGAVIAEIEVADISEDGFLMRNGNGLDLSIGTCFWLKLPGFEPFKSQIVWIEEDKAGCRFLTPLYAALLELILKPEPKPKRRRLFSPPPPPADVAA